MEIKSGCKFNINAFSPGGRLRLKTVLGLEFPQPFQQEGVLHAVKHGKSLSLMAKQAIGGRLLRSSSCLGAPLEMTDV